MSTFACRLLCIATLLLCWGAYLHEYLHAATLKWLIIMEKLLTLSAASGWYVVVLSSSLLISIGAWSHLKLYSIWSTQKLFHLMVLYMCSIEYWDVLVVQLVTDSHGTQNCCDRDQIPAHSCPIDAIEEHRIYNNNNNKKHTVTEWSKGIMNNKW